MLYVVILVAFSYIFAFAFGAFVSGRDPIFLTVLDQFSEIIPGALGGVMFAVIYYELRKVKDRISIESLAHVFD